jgi:hypothetical protein
MRRISTDSNDAREAFGSEPSETTGVGAIVIWLIGVDSVGTTMVKSAPAIRAATTNGVAVGVVFAVRDAKEVGVGVHVAVGVAVDEASGVAVAEPMEVYDGDDVSVDVAPEESYDTT